MADPTDLVQGKGSRAGKHSAPHAFLVFLRGNSLGRKVHQKGAGNRRLRRLSPRAPRRAALGIRPRGTVASACGALGHRLVRAGTAHGAGHRGEACGAAGEPLWPPPGVRSGLQACDPYGRRGAAGAGLCCGPAATRSAASAGRGGGSGGGAGAARSRSGGLVDNSPPHAGRRRKRAGDV